MNVRKMTSKTASQFLAAMLGIGLGLCIPTNIALADDRTNQVDLPQLTAEWWQWAFSIPTAQNPILDPDGGNCMIGQRGSVWFLAGYAGGTTTRTCSLPAGLTLFFPVINSVGFNSPNCGDQGSKNVSVKEMRKTNADRIGSVRLADLRVELDSKTIHQFERVQSDVFAIVLPADNVGGCGPGVYSPAVDEGYYVKLDPLNAGHYTLHIRSTSPLFSFDVTYKLTVVKVVLQ
jgi:hypothetical protein